MHDPDFVLFDVHIPIPRIERAWNTTGPRSFIRRRRRTNRENLGEPTYPWFRPEGYEVQILDNRVRLVELGTVWHSEPNGADAHTYCRGNAGTGFNWRNIQWGWEHRKHLRWQWDLGARTVRWFTDRCEDCGHRFRRSEPRFGTGWDAPGVLHGPCQAKRTLRGQRDDALNVAMGIADSNAEFRVRHLLEQVSDRLATEAIKKALG